MLKLTYDFTPCSNTALIGLSIRSKEKYCTYSKGFKRAIKNEMSKRGIKDVKDNLR